MEGGESRGEGRVGRVGRQAFVAQRSSNGHDHESSLARSLAYLPLALKGLQFFGQDRARGRGRGRGRDMKACKVERLAWRLHSCFFNDLHDPFLLKLRRFEAKYRRHCSMQTSTN